MGLMKRLINNKNKEQMGEHMLVTHPKKNPQPLMPFNVTEMNI